MAQPRRKQIKSVYLYDLHRSNHYVRSSPSHSRETSLPYNRWLVFQVPSKSCGNQGLVLLPYFQRTGLEHNRQATLPSQVLLKEQLKLLVQSINADPDDPIHHVVFSPGLKDRVRCTKSARRGHPARYWYELVVDQANRLLRRHLDDPNTPISLPFPQSAHGAKRALEHSAHFAKYLVTAPTRFPQFFSMYSQSIGGAWQT